MKIGIFTSANKNGEGVPVSFFGCSNEQLLAALYKEALAITGPGLEVYNPEPGIQVRKVGEISVVPVDDKSLYIVEADGTAKPDVERTPPGENGSWAIQSLIFSKDEFTLAEAKKWISEHKDFGDYGVDETETSFRFRQYDTQHFSEYRTITVGKGISAAYGKIDKGTERTKEDADADREKSIELWLTIRKINDGILAKGLKLLIGSAVLHKADDKNPEERFVMSLVLEPTDGADGADVKPDTQDDIYSREEVRYACHYWMEHGGAVDLGHSWKALGGDKVRTLENFIAPCNFTLGKGKDAYDVVEGTWLLALRVLDDELWQGVKSGKIGAYSIGGTAVREEVKQ